MIAAQWLAQINNVFIMVKQIQFLHLIVFFLIKAKADFFFLTAQSALLVFPFPEFSSNVSLFINISLVVACDLLVVAYGILLPDQGLYLGPLHWEYGVLATGPTGKSLPQYFFFFSVD